MIGLYDSMCVVQHKPLHKYHQSHIPFALKVILMLPISQHTKPWWVEKDNLMIDWLVDMQSQ